MLVGIVIASLLGALILVGGLWNIIKIKRRNKTGEEESDESDSSDTDSLELDLKNTDLESRMGTISRAASRSRRRSGEASVRTARTWSPSPPDSLVDDNDRV